MATDVKTSVGRFVWHDCNSTDPEKAKAFYTELFGWELEVWKPGEMDYAMIKAQDDMHGGFGQAQGGAPSHWLGHVIVEDTDAAAERARGLGATVLAGPMDIPEVGRMNVIRDPQGAVVSLFTPAGEAPRSEGVFVWDELMATDVEAAKRFYGEVVGWTAEPMEIPGSPPYTQLMRTDGSPGAGLMTKPDDVPGGAVWLSYVGVADVDAAVAKAESLGGSSPMAAFDVPNVGRVGVIADPTGGVIGVFQPQS